MVFCAIVIVRLRSPGFRKFTHWSCRCDDDACYIGSNARGVYSAREFVGWYNGHPDCASLKPTLFGRTHVSVESVQQDSAHINYSGTSSSSANHTNSNKHNDSSSIDTNGHTAVIIGQGNVALDIARVLLSDPHTLQHTDITSAAIDWLKRHPITNVVIAGRRGPLEVSPMTYVFECVWVCAYVCMYAKVWVCLGRCACMYSCLV
jgi:hypothetical protein